MSEVTDNQHNGISTEKEFFAIYSEKLEQAKQFLGKNWVLHPEYKENPRHNNIKISARSYA